MPNFSHTGWAQGLVVACHVAWKRPVTLSMDCSPFFDCSHNQAGFLQPWSLQRLASSLKVEVIPQVDANAQGACCLKIFRTGILQVVNNVPVYTQTLGILQAVRESQAHQSLAPGTDPLSPACYWPCTLQTFSVGPGLVRPLCKKRGRVLVIIISVTQTI